MNGSESRVFLTKPIITELITNGDDENKIDHPLLQVRKPPQPPPKTNNSNSQSIFKIKSIPPKNMIRTDSKQQKLDMFISISKSQKDEKTIDENGEGLCKNRDIN